MELLPTKATFAPDEPIGVELRGGASRTAVRLLHLDRVVAEAVADPVAVFPPQAPGGYGVEADGARTALDVLVDPLERARYGFVTDFSPGRDPSPAIDTIRRLHLNAVQFYDWMYRHARLLPPEDVFLDPLGRRLSIDTVRRLAAAVRAAGSLPMGYAAVYAAGTEEWPSWQDAGLYRPNGAAWRLGEDFLYVVDPTNDRWRAHLAAELARARAEVGFAGFQLDQYGWPKSALRRDGTTVDLAPAFTSLINYLAARLPGAKLVFNNVNDFPTSSTASADQDAVYIEVWAPHTTLADLGRLVERAHLFAAEKSVVLAAYLPAFAATAGLTEAQAGQDVLLATVFSHGAAAILHGERNAILTDPYFVRHGELTPDGMEATRRYYDFAVRYGDLLFDRGAIDISGTHLGGINDEIALEAPLPVSVVPTPGALWTRALELEDGIVVSVIDLTAQREVAWDAPKRPAAPLSGLRLRIQRRARSKQRFLFADPRSRPALAELEPRTDSLHDSVELPAFSTWALVWIPRDHD